MHMSILASRDVFDHALQDAREVARGVEVRGLSAALDAGLLGRLEETWDAIEAALTAGFQHGRAVAETLFEAAAGKAEQLVAEAGRKARQVHEALLARMQVFVRSYMQGALGRVSPSLTVGDWRYGVRTIKFTQKIVLGGSLKANLTEIFALTTSGEIELAVDYDLIEPRQS